MGFQTVKQKFLESRLSDKDVVLFLQSTLSLFSLLVFYYFSSGSSELRFVFYIISPVLILPPISTYAYYKGFESSSKYSLLFAALFPVAGISTILLSSLGLAAVFLFMAVLLVSAVVPYLILVSALLLHYWRKLKEK